MNGNNSITTYEKVLIKGIPFLLRDGIVYSFTERDPINIGTYDASNPENKFYLCPNWKEKLEPKLIEWRQSLYPLKRSTEIPDGRRNRKNKIKEILS